MAYDKTAPPPLKELQKWFASIITTPIDENSRMNSLSPSGIAVADEAVHFIAQSSTLSPAERIEIYNQQYWWRLLTILQDNYPLVTRLFGYHAFNLSIAFPYLTAHPPSDWSLAVLGDKLPKWAEEHYEGDDKKLIVDAAKLDWSYNEGFIAKGTTPLAAPSEGEDVEALMSVELCWQPALKPLHFDYHLFAFRDQFLSKEPDDWIDLPFPKLIKGSYHGVVYRTPRNELHWQLICDSEYRLLHFFKEGASIAQGCQWLEQQDEKIKAAAEENLHKWIQRWISQQWLVEE